MPLIKINHFGVICIFFILHDHFVIAGIVSGYNNGTSQGTHTMQWYWTVHGYKCTHSPRSRHMRRTVLFILCVNRVKSSSLVISCGNTNPTLSQIACCTKKLAWIYYCEFSGLFLHKTINSHYRSNRRNYLQQTPWSARYWLFYDCVTLTQDLQHYNCLKYLQKSKHFTSVDSDG